MEHVSRAQICSSTHDFPVFSLALMHATNNTNYNGLEAHCKPVCPLHLTSANVLASLSNQHNSHPGGCRRLFHGHIGRSLLSKYFCICMLRMLRMITNRHPGRPRALAMWRSRKSLPEMRLEQQHHEQIPVIFPHPPTRCKSSKENVPRIHHQLDPFTRHLDLRWNFLSLTGGFWGEG